MNKEIAKRLKDSLDYEFDLSFSDRKELLSCIEQLEVDYKEANDSVTWWHNRYNAVERDKEQLENNRDKAIEYIEIELSQGGERELRDLVDGYEVLKLLKGDSDE